MFASRPLKFAVFHFNTSSKWLKIIFEVPSQQVLIWETIMSRESSSCLFKQCAFTPTVDVLCSRKLLKWHLSLTLLKQNASAEFEIATSFNGLRHYHKAIATVSELRCLLKVLLGELLKWCLVIQLKLNASVEFWIAASAKHLREPHKPVASVGHLRVPLNVLLWQSLNWH